jgi:hypothetical protein
VQSLWLFGRRKVSAMFYGDLSGDKAVLFKAALLILRGASSACMRRIISSRSTAT